MSYWTRGPGVSYAKEEYVVKYQGKISEVFTHTVSLNLVYRK